MPKEILVGDLTATVEKAVKAGTATAMEKVAELAKELAAIREENRLLSAKVATQPTMDEALRKGFSIGTYLHGLLREKQGEKEPWKGAERERDVYAAAKAHNRSTKAVSLGNDGGLGLMAPTEMRPIVDLLRSKEIVSKLGVTEVDAKVGRIDIPRDLSDPEVTEAAENAALGSTDTTDDSLAATPKKVGGMVKMSKTLIRCGAGADRFLQNKLFQKYLRRKQIRFFHGTGASGQVHGLDAISGTNTVAFSGAPTVTLILNMLKELESDNADTDASSIKFSMHPRLKYAIAQITLGASSNGYPILAMGDPTKGLAGTIFGVPYETTTDITVSGGTSTTLYLTVGSEILVFNWGVPEVDMSDVAGTSWESDQVWAKLVAEWDMLAPHPEAIVRGTSVTVS